MQPQVTCVTVLPNPNKGNTKSGDSGLEDVINLASAAGTPDGLLEPIPAGQSLSPEDVNQNGVLDNFGTANLGLGFYGTQASATTEPECPHRRRSSGRSLRYHGWQPD
jgi:hypothetical protein